MVSLMNQLPDQGPDMFYTDHWRQLVESHLWLLTQPSNYLYIDLEPQLAENRQGDFYSILFNLNIAKRYHYVILRANGMTSPLQFNGDVNRIIVPNDTVMEDLFRQHRVNYPNTNIYT